MRNSLMLVAFLKCKCFSSWDASILGGLTELPPSSRGAGPPKCCSLEPSWAAFWKESSGSRWYSYPSCFHSCKECRANPALPRAPEDSFNLWLPSRSSQDLPDEVKEGFILSPATPFQKQRFSAGKGWTKSVLQETSRSIPIAIARRRVSSSQP